MLTHLNSFSHLLQQNLEGMHLGIRQSLSRSHWTLLQLQKLQQKKLNLNLVLSREQEDVWMVNLQVTSPSLFHLLGHLRRSYPVLLVDMALHNSLLDLAQSMELVRLRGSWYLDKMLIKILKELQRYSLSIYHYGEKKIIKKYILLYPL